MAHFTGISNNVIITIVALIAVCSHAQNLNNPQDIVAGIRHAHAVKEAARKYTEEANQPETSSLKGFIQDSTDRIAECAEELLANGLVVDEGNSSGNTSYEVSAKCLNHTEMVIRGLINREKWALRMVDAMGKPSSGLLDFNTRWLGSYDECVNVQALVNSSKTGLTTPFKGRYCSASYCLAGSCSDIGQGVALSVGICLPDSCDADDARGLVNTLVSLIPGVNASDLPIPTTTCQIEDLELSGKAIAVVTLCAIFAAILVIATLYDILVVQDFVRDLCRPSNLKLENMTSSKYGAVVNTDAMADDTIGDETPLLASNGHVTQNGTSIQHQPHPEVTKIDIDHRDENRPKAKTNSYNPGTLGKILLSFSMYTNASKILSTSQPAGTLSAVNGIRFLSMTWVILGHSYLFGIQTVGNLLTFMPEMIKRFTFQAIGNATFSVDTFFALSGLLLAYLSLKEMKRVGGAKKFKWGMYYFHRFWRLTPPYMLFLMLYVPTIKYWYNGPLWSQTGIDINECKDSWWTNLLYINNLVKTDEMCMTWSWYLANDMQFFVISPLLLIPLFYSPLLGLLCCGAFILTNFIAAGLVSSHYGLDASILVQQNTMDYMNHYYRKPWCRIGPYVIGIVAGYVLYRTDCKLRMPKIVNLLGWTVSTAVALLVVYGLWDSGTGIQDFSTGVSALYNATSRTAWGACVCWVIVACATGYGGPVNKILSWPAIIPLSRLTYCAYLVHPVVMTVYAMSRRTLMYWYDLQMIYLFFGHLIISYAAAFIISLAFESPMMGLEKVLLGRKKSI